MCICTELHAAIEFIRDTVVSRAERITLILVVEERCLVRLRVELARWLKLSQRLFILPLGVLV